MICDVIVDVDIGLAFDFVSSLDLVVAFCLAAFFPCLIAWLSCHDIVWIGSYTPIQIANGVKYLDAIYNN